MGILNLPDPRKGTTSAEYSTVLSKLTESIDRVLFVHSCLEDHESSCFELQGPLLCFGPHVLLCFEPHCFEPQLCLSV